MALHVEYISKVELGDPNTFCLSIGVSQLTCLYLHIIQVELDEDNGKQPVLVQTIVSDDLWGTRMRLAMEGI